MVGGRMSMGCLYSSTTLPFSPGMFCNMHTHTADWNLHLDCINTLSSLIQHLLSKVLSYLVQMIWREKKWKHDTKERLLNPLVDIQNLRGVNTYFPLISLFSWFANWKWLSNTHDQTCRNIMQTGIENTLSLNTTRRAIAQTIHICHT